MLTGQRGWGGGNGDSPPTAAKLGKAVDCPEATDNSNSIWGYFENVTFLPLRRLRQRGISASQLPSLLRSDFDKQLSQSC